MMIFVDLKLKIELLFCDNLRTKIMQTRWNNANESGNDIDGYLWRRSFLLE